MNTPTVGAKVDTTVGSSGGISMKKILPLYVDDSLEVMNTWSGIVAAEIRTTLDAAISGCSTAQSDGVVVATLTI